MESKGCRMAAFISFPNLKKDEMPGARLKWRFAADLNENAGKIETVGKNSEKR